MILLLKYIYCLFQYYEMIYEFALNIFFSKKGYKDANFTNNIDLSIGGDNNINY